MVNTLYDLISAQLEQVSTVNVLKFQTLFSFCSQLKCWLSWTEFFPKWQTEKTLIRLFLQKQSDQGLFCLSMPYWQATSVQKIRIFTILFEPVSIQGLHKGAQWLSGRVLDSRPRGSGFEPHQRHCVVVLEQDTFILA